VVEKAQQELREGRREGGREGAREEGRDGRPSAGTLVASSPSLPPSLPPCLPARALILHRRDNPTLDPVHLLGEAEEDGGEGGREGGAEAGLALHVPTFPFLLLLAPCSGVGVQEKRLSRPTGVFA